MKNKKLKIAGIIALIITVILIGFGVYYVNDYYRSDESVNEYLQGTENVTVSEIADGLFLDGSGEDTAVIFYPGAKVEYTAYVPLFVKLAEEGVDCFLVEMPCNLAILGMNKADSIMESYTYDEWYLAGHSLGGAMAASYASEHLNDLEGLILLAAYPTKSLASSDFKVLSIYGSEDTVLNMENLEEGRSFMPENYTEVCMEGGNHAQFGAYGAQEGDGEARITAEEQKNETVKEIIGIIQ